MFKFFKQSSLKEFATERVVTRKEMVETRDALIIAKKMCEYGLVDVSEIQKELRVFAEVLGTWEKQQG